MKKVHHLLLSFLALSAFELSAQPTNQDCLGAIAICQTFFAESNAYSGTGNVLNEINPATSCLASGEKNDVWYTFTVQTSGSLCFTITPNLATDDYDWAVFDLTSASCSDIFGNPALEISCNFDPATGATGPNGLGGPQNESCLTVTAGEIYVVNVSQFSPSPNGYTIDFSASGASIFDNSSPVIQTVDDTVINCGDASITFSFSESVLCSTVDDGDFTLSGPGGPYTLSGVTGAACAGGGTQEIQYTANISPAISAGGSFSLCMTSSAGITDLCGNVAPATCLPFTVAGLSISTVSIVDITCFNTSTGSATVAASGGQAPYTYVWSTSPSQTGATAVGLSGGFYAVTATDNDGCSGTITVTVLEPKVIPTSFDVTCDSLGCDGSASVSPVGGTSPYSYQWYDQSFNPLAGETNSSINNLCAGAWCVVVTDNANCKDTTCVTILLPAVNITPTLTSCIGYCDGVAALTANGGLAPFTYQWQNPLGVPIAGETDSILDSLCLGTYYLDIQTANACNLVDSVEILDPQVVDANINTFKDACFGTCDGNAAVTTSGGLSPYTYTWDDPNAQTLALATGLCAGTYIVSVTDANGCGPDIDTITIGTNPEIITTITVIDQNCDSVDGSATAVVTGGIVPYSYLWDNAGASTLANALGLFAGTNLLVVTDSSQCTDSVTVLIGYADSAKAMINVDQPITCTGLCDGELSVVGISGDTIVSQVWSIKDTVPSIDSLCPDTSFSVTAYNQDGCPTVLTVLLTEPELITSTISSSSETSCNSQDGSITLSPAGGTPPYTFTWSPVISTTASVGNLSAGTYSVTLDDANNCPPDSQTATLAVPPPIVPATVPAPASCFGFMDGSVIASITSGGASPYTFTWDASGSVAGTDSTSSNTVLGAGTYTVSVTDINNCPITTSSSVVVEPDQINTVLNFYCINGEGAISSTTTGGTPGYDYIWSNGSIFSELTLLDPGTYSVTVTDVVNCPPDEETVVVLPCDVEIPTAFTPNDDGENDLWDLKNLQFFAESQISVYNRWGDLVYKTTGYDNPWDGKHRATGIDLPTAVYYYVIENVAEDYVAEGSRLVGYVTIVRP